MKFVSYLIIMIVVTIVGWATDNSMQSIFVKHPTATFAAPVQATNQFHQTTDLTDFLSTVTGN